MTKYLVYDTEAEAETAQSTIAASIGLPITGRNAATGALEPNKTITDRWANPQETATGKWVIPSNDGTGVDWDSAWDFPEE